MDTKNPTNADIYQTLGTVLERLDGNHKVYTKEFDEIKKRQDHTNGNVSDLMSWREGLVIAEKAGIEAVKKYKKDNPQPQLPVTNLTPIRWYHNERLVAAVVALLLAISTFLSIDLGR